MLWEIIKERMQTFPLQKVYENDNYMTYEQIIAYAELFSKKLNKKAYAILCHSQLFTGISILACLAAGVTAIPLSYKYGYNHLRRIVDYVNPPYVISDIGNNLHIVNTDIGKYKHPKSCPAFIMCTSGTTGTPKGIMLSENNIYSNLTGISDYFKIDEDDNILITRPLYHCAVLTGEFLIALYSGVCIHFNDCTCNPSEILKYVQKNNISIFCSTPTVISMLTKFIELKKTSTKMKTIVISGEVLHKHTAKEISQYFHKQNIYHVYGLTEASPRVAYLNSQNFHRYGHKLDSLVKGVSAKIVNDNGEEVPPGTKGELIIKGDNIMIGYYKKNALTKKTLVNGWLHTNDIAISYDDGSFEIIGRKDNMLICGGMNIYPSEIENILKKNSHIKDVVAYGINRPYVGTQIGINVSSELKDKHEILKICREILPSYAVPTFIECYDELPKNGSYKAIRKNLKQGEFL